MPRITLGVGAVLLLALGGCNKASPMEARDAGSKAAPTAVSLGQSGESCTSHGDCASGLACIANVCSGSAQSGDARVTGPDGGPAMKSDPRGAAGESCTARRDCQEGLACIENRCAQPPSGMQATGSTERGAKGESCQSRADCVQGLACVAGSCRDVEVPFKTLPKQCHEVQCQVTADCCKGFPLTSAQCVQYKSDCSSGTTSACTFYKQICECTRVCDGDQCVQDLSCSADLDCPSSLTPYCVSKACVGCRSDTDCTLTGEKCVAHACKKPCEHDEECPFSQGTAGMPITITACMGGECKDRDCKSDRECYFASSDPEAKCGGDGKCTRPCVNDGDCKAAFNVCEAGLCVFVGCDTDAECRLALGLGSATEIGTAICK
jgi:hypothetical protein